MVERRNQKRFDTCLDLVWSGSATSCSARITDISEGGCYIDSIGHVEVGENIRMKIQMPWNQYYIVSARAHNLLGN